MTDGLAPYRAVWDCTRRLGASSVSRIREVYCSEAQRDLRMPRLKARAVGEILYELRSAGVLTISRSGKHRRVTPLYPRSTLDEALEFVRRDE